MTIEQAQAQLEQEIIACRKCPRLVAWREQVAVTKRRAYMEWEYWGKPVPGFGDLAGRVLVVGLAPGAHGANRTGRMFTGDGSGEFLYRALHRAGFANQPSTRDRHDGLRLDDLYISAVCRCAPPGNRPTTEEISNCLPYLKREIALMSNLKLIVALGGIALQGAMQAFAYPKLPFAHGAVYPPKAGRPWVVVSYHPSLQNTQTGRLTEGMFAGIWSQVRAILDEQA